MKESRVLCVEDEKDTQELLFLALGQEVDEWLQAYNGEEACRILRQKEVDLVLLDIDLPKLRGNEILRRLRQRGRSCSVIVVSGNATNTDLIDLINYDADYFLQKPIDLMELKQTIQKALRKRIEQSFSERDSLTSVLNRRAFVLSVERWMNEGRNFTLFVIDLDDFKQINDRFGHLAGDAALKEVAKRLQNLLRKTDLIGRYGGDEFSIVVEGLQEDGAVVHQKIYDAFKEPVGEFGVTLSVGDAFFDGSCETFEELFAKADERMYANKRQKKALRDL